MNIQIIKSVNGDAEYVLLPIHAYEALKPQIEKLLSDDYEEFIIDDYISNPVALARINANLTQEELANLMNVTQAYVSKIEGAEKVSVKTIAKVKSAINHHRS